MPNNVYSVLKFHYHNDDGELIKSISDKLKGDNSILDFNKIIPQPVGIQHEDKYVLSDAEHAWNRDNWGTKWNAFDIEVIVNESYQLIITFQTAWNISKPIILKIIELFPNVGLKFIAADDGHWFAYSFHKSEDENIVTINEWNNENDKEGYIRGAVFNALNLNY